MQKKSSVVSRIGMVFIASTLIAGCNTKVLPTPDKSIWDCACEGEVDLLAQHLDVGTDIHDTFDAAGVPGTGGTPLHLAALCKQYKTMDLLLQRGADIHRKALPPDPGGGTPLHWAVVANDRTGVEKLLNAGADINALDKNGLKPLIYVFINVATGQTYTNENLPFDRHGVRDFLVSKGAQP